MPQNGIGMSEKNPPKRLDDDDHGLELLPGMSKKFSNNSQIKQVFDPTVTLLSLFYRHSKEIPSISYFV